MGDRGAAATVAVVTSGSPAERPGVETGGRGYLITSEKAAER